MSILNIIIITYSIINLICGVLLIYSYFILKRYYKHIKYKEKETGKERDLLERFAPLVPIDNINFFSYIIIGQLIFPIRIFLVLGTYYILRFHIKILKFIYRNHEKDPKQRQKIEKVTHFWLSIYFFINNISLEKKEVEYKDIYKKYLGNDYDFNQKDFSLYISNHLGYLEIAAYMKEYAVSLLITYELLRTPAIGGVMAELGSFFLDRENSKSRENSLETLLKRQKDFYNKKSFVKTLIFPEGTTTNGKYIAAFKRGAFLSLLPLKPLMVFYYDGFLCSTNRFFFFLRTVATFKIIIKYAELPIIKPTEYMFEKYKNLGNEKWEIYAKVVNIIYAEIGGLKQTDIRFRDRLLYYQAAEDGFYNDK